MKNSILIVTALCLLAACSAPGPISLNKNPAACVDEKILWHNARQEQLKIDASGLLYQDSQLENYLNRIVAKLQINSGCTDISFQVKIIRDPHLNAFALPHGAIYIHTGILARMDNEAQLAALLAHEMTHCTHRHALKVMRLIKNRSAHMAAIEQTLGKIPAIRELTRVLGQTASMAAVNGYTRELETEADRGGLDLVVKAGYDPRQALALFKHLSREIELEGIKEPFFFGTHPNVQQRIENVSDWLASEFNGQTIGVTKGPIFRTHLKQLILVNASLDLQQGRFAAACRGVEKYLQTHLQDARACYLFGEILRQRAAPGDSLTALKWYEKAVMLDPSYAAAFQAMGMIHYKQGHRLLAQKYFQTCLSLAPDTPDRAYIEGYLAQCTINQEG
jgi:predicted Zn-dependent protease